MILDYGFSKSGFTVSYISPNGHKSIIRYPHSPRIPTYAYCENGEYTSYDERKCTQVPAQKISWSDYLDFMRNDVRLNDAFKDATHPRLYTFDIETEFEDDEFPHPNVAKYPITCISLVSPEYNVIVLGTRPLKKDQQQLQNRYDDFLQKSEYYQSHTPPTTPTFKYMQFNNEHDMLEWFLKKFVARVPVIAGWNSVTFDWQYIQTRLRREYPDLSIEDASIVHSTVTRAVRDGDNIIHLSFPTHTLVWDMMDIVTKFDFAVMPIKENSSLEYIASNTINEHKVSYNGTLQDALHEDYDNYVFYNAIDSVLVQMIDHHFGTTALLYGQALIAHNKIETAFSKIAIAESVFFDYYYTRGMKIVPKPRACGERGEYEGAYVRTPVPGRHSYVCCNDFASLYPSIIITCNFSIENYVGKCSDMSDADVVRFKNDPNYFVSVLGSIYKNDRDYAFKVIQQNLKSLRAKSKYLGKKIDATVKRLIESLLSNPNQAIDGIELPDDVMAELDPIFKQVTIKKLSTQQDFAQLSCDELNSLSELITQHMSLLTNREMSLKYIMNSMYGGVSHQAFEWYRLDTAADITAEGRALIHYMENNITSHIQSKWTGMSTLHELLGIKMKPGLVVPTLNEILPPNTGVKDVVTKDSRLLIQPVAGDTDSIYLCYEGLLNTIDGVEDMSDMQKCDILVKFNTDYLNRYNHDIMEDYYNSRHVRSMVHEFELETLSRSEIRLPTKKRYAQLLLWKDGKRYDTGLKFKSKGIEVVKSSYPKTARTWLKESIISILSSAGGNDELRDEIYGKVTSYYNTYKQLPIESISPSIWVSGWNKYVDDDTLKTSKGCPFALSGLVIYEAGRRKYKQGDLRKGGKLMYCMTRAKDRRSKPGYFTYPPPAPPAWVKTCIKVDYASMFMRTYVNPLNRILEAIGISPITDIYTHIQPTLF